MDQAATPSATKKKGGKPGARGQASAPVAAIAARSPAKAAAAKIPPIQTLASDASDARSRQVLAALMAFAGGDFSARLPNDWSGVDARIAEAFNQSISNSDRITREAARL